MNKIINVADLTQAAIQYDPVLRALPFVSLSQFAGALGLNIQEVANEHIIVNRRRVAGATGPYKAGMEIEYQKEIMKFYESPLKPELVVSKTRDNITNYKDKMVLVLAGNPLDIKTKTHPLAQMIINDVVISHTEDVIFSSFFAERDDDVFSPMSAFTGFYTKIGAMIAAGLIATGDSNLKTTGAFIITSSDTDYEAYNKLVDFVGSAHPLLRSSIGGTPQLLITQTVLKAARAAYRNKVRTHDYPSIAQMLDALREDAFCPTLEFSFHEALGTGSKLVLQKKGNMDLGFNTQAAAQFVQVRNPFEDPNEVQFWLESAYDTRIQDIHCKKFLTNEQTNTALDLAGDYKIVDNES